MKLNRIKLNYILVIASSVVLLSACKEDAVLPKPNGFLRLEYPVDTYRVSKAIPYQFETPKTTRVLLSRKQWMRIIYPNIKATINITYRPVNNNMKELLKEATKLTLTHVKKADDIFFDSYENKQNNTYGKVGNVTGNTASPIQFYLTDKTKHFITGTVYFDIQPNYDSIYPAIKFIKKDILHLMETTQWHSK